MYAADSAGSVFVAGADVLDTYTTLSAAAVYSHPFFVPAEAPHLARSFYGAAAVQDLVLSCGLSAREEVEEGTPWVHYHFDTFCSALTHSYCDW